MANRQAPSINGRRRQRFGKTFGPRKAVGPMTAMPKSSDASAGERMVTMFPASMSSQRDLPVRQIDQAGVDRGEAEAGRKRDG